MRPTPKSVDRFDPTAPAPMAPLPGAAESPAPAPSVGLPSITKLVARMRAEHMGLVLTMSYLVVAAFGMLHEALVFARFRINILDYAEPSDFLLAALRDPLILVVALVAFPLVGLYYRYVVRAYHRRTSVRQRWWHGSERSRAFMRRHYTLFFVSTSLLYMLAFSLAYGNHVARKLRAGDGPHVRVELVADPGGLQRDTTPLLLLGTTQKYLFLYDPARQVTSILPSSNVARVIVGRRAPEPGK